MLLALLARFEQDAREEKQKRRADEFDADSFQREVSVNRLSAVAIVLLAGSLGLMGGKAAAATTHKVGHLGTTIRIPGKLDVRYDGYTVSAGNGSVLPDPGNEFIITHWFFHNYQNKKVYISANGFELDAGSHTYLPEMGSTKLSKISNDTLGLVGQTYKPGHSDGDDIVFQVSVAVMHDKSVKKLLVFAPFFIHPDIRGVWRVK
jgi:hypothetical protein